MAKNRRPWYFSGRYWRWKRDQISQLPARIRDWGLRTYRKWFPKKMTDREHWESWQQQLDRLHEYIIEVFRHRKIFNELTEMLQVHPTLATDTNAGYFYDWLRDLYAHYITMAVRRELDRSPDVVNLQQLLWQIYRRPHVASRARYLQHFANIPPNRGMPMEHWEDVFTSNFGAGAHIDAAIVKKDMDDLEAEARVVKRYADRVVAHQTEDQVQATIRDVNQALEHVETILQKYYALLTGNSLIVEPTIGTPWWMAFRVPWLLPVRDDEAE